jgi:hypothetical protein
MRVTRAQADITMRSPITNLAPKAPFASIGGAERTTAHEHPGAHMVPTTTGLFRDFLRTYFDDLVQAKRAGGLPEE